MSLHKQYRKDKATNFLAVTDDIQVECSHFDPRQAEYVAIMTRITKPVRKLVEQNLLKPEQDRKYAVRCFVECCMKSWRTSVGKDEWRPEINVSEDEGKAEWLPFTIDNAVNVFSKYPQFFSDTVELARDISNYQVTDAELKNSENA